MSQLSNYKPIVKKLSFLSIVLVALTGWGLNTLLFEFDYSFSHQFVSLVLEESTPNPAYVNSLDGRLINIICFLIYSLLGTVIGAFLSGKRQHYLLIYTFVSVFLLQLALAYSGCPVRNFLGLILTISLAFYISPANKKNDCIA